MQSYYNRDGDVFEKTLSKEEKGQCIAKRTLVSGEVEDLLCRQTPQNDTKYGLIFCCVINTGSLWVELKQTNCSGSSCLAVWTMCNKLGCFQNIVSVLEFLFLSGR